VKVEDRLPDRRVHAECATFEVVRYERAGKWYVESKVGLVPREHIGVAEAARRAISAKVLGGEINYGVPGGKVFDRKVALLDG
jgi:hypothetical protein